MGTPDKEALIAAMMEAARRMKREELAGQLMGRAGAVHDELDNVMLGICHLGNLGTNHGPERVLAALGGVEQAETLAFVLGNMASRCDAACKVAMNLSAYLLDACRDVRTQAKKPENLN